MTPYDLIVDKRVPMFSPAELDEIKRIATKLPDNPVVIIIGAGVGAASMTILQTRSDALIFSIDNQFPTKQPMYQPGERANLIKAGLWEQGRVIQVWGESQIVGKRWPVNCDWLIIDGDHRYDAVAKDIELWLSKATSYVSLHDYAPIEKKPKAGVKQAVDEMIDLEKESLVKWLITFKV